MIAIGNVDRSTVKPKDSGAALFLDSATGRLAYKKGNGDLIVLVGEDVFNSLALVTASLTVEGNTTLEGTLYVDSIKEYTSGNGVLIESSCRFTSTGLHIEEDGVVAEPSCKIGSSENGFYEVSATQLGVSIDDTLVAIFDDGGIAADYVKPRLTQGTVNTGVTAFTTGDGLNFVTVLTINVTNALTVADNAALADGYLLFTLPTGAIVITAAYMGIQVTLAEDTTATPEVGLGTVEASGAVSVLSGTATFENILTGQVAADCNGTATVKTVANQPLVIESGDAHTIYFNIANTWADTAGIDLTGDISGTVTIKWTKMA